MTMESQTQEQDAISGINAQPGNRMNRSGNRGQMPWSEEEMVVFKKWQRDSFWYKCMPMTGFLIFSSEFLIRKGRLKFIGSWHPFIRIPFMIVNGIILGRMMSVGDLQTRMVEQCPDGFWAQTIKKSRGARENMADGTLEPAEQDAAHKQVPQRAAGYNDTIPPVLRGDAKPQRKSYYDRLREENKEYSSESVSDKGFPKPPPKEPLFFTEKTPEGTHRGKKTKYGDAWEE